MAAQPAVDQRLRHGDRGESPIRAGLDDNVLGLSIEAAEQRVVQEIPARAPDALAGALLRDINVGHVGFHLGDDSIRRSGFRVVEVAGNDDILFIKCRSMALTAFADRSWKAGGH